MKKTYTLLSTLLMASFLPLNHIQAASDTEKPYVWATSLSPNESTTQNVTIQIHAGDYDSGVKNITLPDNSVVPGSFANYTVSQNGKYSFKITDTAGNDYVHPVFVSNIDRTPPTISSLSLNREGDGTYEVSVKANDNVEIDEVVLNTNQSLTKGLNEDKYTINHLTTKPDSVTVKDSAGLRTSATFLSLPSISVSLPSTSKNAPYSPNKVVKEDVQIKVDGSDALHYKIGSTEYNCLNKPCVFNLNKNETISATNSIPGKSSTLVYEVNNINKNKDKLVLSFVRENNKIELSWNLPISSPLVNCESLDTGKTSKQASGTSFSFLVLNENYQCSVSGQYQNYDIQSDVINIAPDYTKEIYVASPSNSYSKETFQKVHVDYNMLGVTYFINANRNDSANKEVPIPNSLR
ncbi:hypothetical protein U8V72_23265 [Priestia filamentosa]|uniref:hypothetical protein n=1 Tax=Priestia filamentosa TaxID=1402861 RepID=UPI00397938F6